MIYITSRAHLDVFVENFCQNKARLTINADRLDYPALILHERDWIDTDKLASEFDYLFDDLLRVHLMRVEQYVTDLYGFVWHETNAKCFVCGERTRCFIPSIWPHSHKIKFGPAVCDKHVLWIGENN